MNNVAMKVNRQNQAWYNIVTNQAGSHADIYLYGVIGGYYANVQQFLYDLNSFGNVQTITVYLNTVGGSFYDGLPIYNTLKQHKAYVTVKVMGYALSMGSVIMLAGDSIEAAENALIMIHRALGDVVGGDAEEMTKAAEILLKHEAAIIPEYMRRLNKTAEEVAGLLAAETWFTAAEAKAAGLIDVITQVVDVNLPDATRLYSDSFEFASKHFKHVPDNLKQMLKVTNNQDLQGIDVGYLATVLADRLKPIFSTPKAEILEKELRDLQKDYLTVSEKYRVLKAEMDELSKEIPGDVVPINTGPAGSFYRGGRW